MNRNNVLKIKAAIDAVAVAAFSIIFYVKVILHLLLP